MASLAGLWEALQDDLRVLGIGDPANRLMPTADEAAYRMKAMREGDPVSKRGSGFGPPIAGVEDYLISSLDAVTPFFPVAGTLRGVRGAAAKRPYFHGTHSQESGNTTDPRKILKEGFTRGQSFELEKPGTSVSEDPLVSLINFTTPRYMDPSDAAMGGLRNYTGPWIPDEMLIARMNDPENALNIPPDFYKMAVISENPGATVRKPNFMAEAETFGLRTRQGGGPLKDEKAFEQGMEDLKEHAETEGFDMDFDALYRSIDELLEHVEDPSYAEKMRDYVKQVERQGIYSADDAIFDLYDEADKLDVGRFSGAEQVTPGLTPVRGGSSGPQKFTEQELDWLQNAGENYQKYSSMLSGNYYKYRNRPGGDRKAVTFLTEHPKIAVVDFMGALEGLKGNRGQFKQAMDTVANRFMPNNTSSADWQKHWKDALGPEKYGEIVLKAQEYMRGRARTDQFADMVGTEARNPRSGMNQKMQQMGIKTFEDVERAISEGRMTLNDIGSPELRKMYRENIRHRDEFYNTMYNTVNKTKGPAKMLNPYSDATGGIDYDAIADEIVELEEQLDELIPTSPEWGKVNQELLKLIEKSQTLMP